ncbi:MAG: toprim domain-containing protein [Ruminococcus sp.]|nr:toprim domain-containing protein [Ruminococcus sp.]
MDKKSAKEEVKLREPDFLPTAKKKVHNRLTYICPVCANGTGKDGDGIVFDPKADYPHWKCYKCGLYEDIIGLWKAHTNYTDNSEVFRTLYEHYGITIDEMFTDVYSVNNVNIPKNKSDNLSSNTTEPESDYTDFFLQANKNLMQTSYHRGISLETLNRFNIGYVADWRHPKTPLTVPTSPRLIIPTSKYSYLARDTRENLTATQKKYSKSKVGNVHIFNVNALQTDDKPVFVVEGEIDALSIIDVGGEAVAIGSTSNVNIFLNCLKDCTNLYSKKPTLILLLDNDTAGQKATEKIIEGLQDMDIVYYKIDIVAPYKDANEALTADREQFSAKVEESTLNPEQSEQLMQEMKYMETSVTAHLQDFLNGISQSVNTPYISTGFKALDTILDGGLYEGLYIVGAISSLGKTTLFTQICDQIAQNGDDVLIFSLEMARTELMAKTISRLTFIDTLKNKTSYKDAKTARGITTGSRYANYSLTEKELIQRAINTYRSFSDHVFIHEGIGDIGVTKIREVVQQHISIMNRKPVVLIDYLQILAPTNDRSSDKQNTDKAVLELKRISRDFKIPVIAISSFNRENYNSPVNLTSFKESGAIEYSSDVLIGLQLQGIGNSNFDVTKEKAKVPREIELVILKNRNGQTGKKVAYDYHTMFNYFEEKGII